MNTDKIREAITDLQEQKDLIESAIQSLQQILVRLNGNGQSRMAFVKLKAEVKEASYLDTTVQLLQSSGRPMHIMQIVEQIRVLRNNPNIKRSPVETSLIRHIQSSGKDARVVKVRRATFGLPKSAEPRPLQPTDN